MMTTGMVYCTDTTLPRCWPGSTEASSPRRVPLCPGGDPPHEAPSRLSPCRSCPRRSRRRPCLDACILGDGRHLVLPLTYSMISIWVHWRCSSPRMLARTKRRLFSTIMKGVVFEVFVVSRSQSRCLRRVQCPRSPTLPCSLRRQRSQSPWFAGGGGGGGGTMF